jgi:hypothetical protein
MEDDFVLGLDAFVRSIRINRATPHAFLIGAGASISSGLPSAESCIWEWKRAIFLTNNPGLETQFWESHFKLSERVVIHKQTEFTDDERNGLQAGLSGRKAN